MLWIYIACAYRGVLMASVRRVGLCAFMGLRRICLRKKTHPKTLQPKLEKPTPQRNLKVLMKPHMALWNIPTPSLIFWSDSRPYPQIPQNPHPQLSR